MSTGRRSYGDPATRARILASAWELVAERGSNLKLTEVAKRAGVSRQALYLHFGDRTGLLLALVDHMDETFDLGQSLAHVRAAPTAFELLRRAMRLNTEFWAAAYPVAQVLEAAQYDDEALGVAWRDRMQARQMAFAAMIQQISDHGFLAEEWTVGDAAELLYAVAHVDTWRLLIRELAWTDDRYVEAMTQLLGRSLVAR